jgi:hypothetical protein
MLVAERTMAREDLTATRRDIASAADSLVKLAQLDERLLEMVESQREVFAEMVRTELQGVTAEVDRQRQETLGAVTQEREAILASIGKQREETLAAFTAEREAIVEAVDRETDKAFESARKEWTAMLEAIRTERKQTMIEIETLTGSALARTHENAETLVDRFFLRLVQAGGGLIVLGAVAMFLLRRFAGRSAAA